MMFNGSRAALMFFIIEIPSSPNCSFNNPILPNPIPCSPVHVPEYKNYTTVRNKTILAFKSFSLTWMLNNIFFLKPQQKGKVKETVSVMPSDPPSMQRWQCPIHNGTLPSFVWSGMNSLSMLLILKTEYFYLWYINRNIIIKPF